MRLFARVRAAALAAIVSWAAAPTAGAAVVGEAAAAASIGATSNAQGLSTGSPSAFSTVSALARLRAESLRANGSISYRLALTHYFVEGAVDTISNELVATSALEISRALSLSLNAGAMVTRSSNVGTTNVPGQAALPGSRLYVASTAGELLAYAPTERLRLAEQVAVARVDYLTSSLGESATGRPSTAVTAGLRADYAWTRDTIFLEVRGTELIAEAGIDTLGNSVPAGNTLFAEELVGWRRDLSLAWSAQLQAGAAWVREPSGQAVWLPAGIATLEYRHLPWYATLSLQHGPVADLFLGVVTVNDQASLHLTLPLDRGDLVVLAGFASYARARVALRGNGLVAPYDYDQGSAGSILSVRFRQLPLFGSLMYSVIDQHGTSATGGQALDVVRHTVMLNITAVFQWGPGAPPLLGGGLI